MTQTNNEREALLDKLLAEYWDIAYSEGNSGLWHGKKAQSTLNDIRKLFKTQSTISQNEQQESVTNLWEALGKWSAYLASNGEQANLAPPSWLIDAVSSATSPPKQAIPEGWVAVPVELLKDITNCFDNVPSRAHVVNGTDENLKRIAQWVNSSDGGYGLYHAVNHYLQSAPKLNEKG